MTATASSNMLNDCNCIIYMLNDCNCIIYMLNNLSRTESATITSSARAQGLQLHLPHPRKWKRGCNFKLYILKEVSRSVNVMTVS
jgi:hypothetical protein